MDSFWWFVVLVAGVGVGTWIFRPRGRVASAMLDAGKEEMANEQGMTAEGARATRMRVDFTLIEHGEEVIKDTLTLTGEAQSKVYETRTGGTSRELTVTYEFGHPASLQIEGPTWQTVLAMGVHLSSEPEEIAVGEAATLVFECTPLP